MGLLLMFNGCMSNMQDIRINASPPDTVVFGGGVSTVGRGTLTLERGEDVTLVARAPGYVSQSKTLKSHFSGGRLATTIIHDVLFIPLTIGLSLLIGLPVHLENGTVDSLEPDEVTFNLVPEPKENRDHARDPVQVNVHVAPQAPPPQPPPSSSPQKKARRFCSSCGASVAPKAKFCAGCGARQ